MTVTLNALIKQSGLITSSVSALLALSRLFAAGGEQMSHTLPELVKSTQNLGLKLPQMRQTGQDLAAYSQVKPLELRQMCFEFNRLFVGPTSPIAPPYESVYLSPERLVMQEHTLEVRQMYQAENLMATSQGTAPDDFIATELEFAAYLLNCVSRESSRGNSSNAVKYLDLYNEFMQKHPQRWLKLFAASVLENARHPVFPLIMQVLLGTIELAF
ncbi:molecular chaperone TorD family protein [Desulfosporosinus sp. PR]|uniref:TorD/DmsD family molecular chaperone n=1 Tax=Candidatus Desulfosporosinus nitrosoreducens TaxID=3401928 RepID=UPI0027FA1626|nr:molecular chaperone TorD family protein [Desulfosporosinus sp. PR]MDQ7094062.1 molecular chaperone TorD family protein [Desulfosporosinus sp. PR]